MVWLVRKRPEVGLGRPNMGLEMASLVARISKVDQSGVHCARRRPL
jgi:hypothetical protein